MRLQLLTFLFVGCLLGAVELAAASRFVEIPLPGNATKPLALAFDPQGQLWFTLDGSWAIGRYTPANASWSLVPLAAPKAEENDSLWALRFGPDGSLWTGSQTHVHRVYPANLTAAAYKLPTRTLLTGDVHVAGPNAVWLALTASDRIVRLDPATGATTDIRSPPAGDRGFGPLQFHAAGPTVYLTGTYAGAYATFNPTTGAQTAGPTGLLAGPVGLTDQGGRLWIAEMGGDTVARVDPKTGARERFPTTPSPYYEISGPSDVAIGPDGAVWFIEHFADRIARLDPEARTLHEIEVPSAPGTNVQRLAFATNGTLWFAEWSKHRIGFLEYQRVEPSFGPLAPVTVAAGKTGRVSVQAPGSLVAGTGEANLTARVEGGDVVVDATKAAPGTYNVLVSSRSGKEWLGRYVAVTVKGGDSPGPDVIVLLALVAVGLGLARRRA